MTDDDDKKGDSDFVDMRVQKIMTMMNKTAQILRKRKNSLICEKRETKKIMWKQEF